MTPVVSSKVGSLSFCFISSSASFIASTCSSSHSLSSSSSPSNSALSASGVTSGIGSHTSLNRMDRCWIPGSAFSSAARCSEFFPAHAFSSVFVSCSARLIDCSYSAVCLSTSAALASSSTSSSSAAASAVACCAARASVLSSTALRVFWISESESLEKDDPFRTSRHHLHHATPPAWFSSGCAPMISLIVISLMNDCVLKWPSSSDS